MEEMSFEKSETFKYNIKENQNAKTGPQKIKVVKISILKIMSIIIIYSNHCIIIIIRTIEIIIRTFEILSLSNRCN